ncbi:MAG: hypothetical protein J6V90_08790 [Treponema sp.]|nr:hypothetical protein [Treponema sp.]
MKKLLLTFVFSVASFCAFSKSFSLQVVQKNTPGDQVFDASFVVEQTILDHFFDRGMIVSNNSVLISKNDAAQDKTDLRRSMIEAKIGCMDLFVKLSLNYSVLDSANPTAVLLSNIKSADLEIVSLEENKTICKGKFTPPALTDLNNNRSGVEDFAADIANKIQAELAERGGAI